MTFDHLIQYFTQYYNQDGALIYSKLDLKILSSELGGKSSEYLDAVFKVVCKNHSKKWKVLPDIAIINEYRKEIDEECKTLLLKSQRALPAPVETVDREGLKKLADCLIYGMTGKKPEWTR